MSDERAMDVTSASRRGGEGGPGRPQGEMRCGCGNLLARLVPEGVELKCRRCKRTVVLPLGEGEARGTG